MKNSPSYRRFITLHPVKQPEAMRRIHLSSEILRLNKMRQERMKLIEQLEELRGMGTRKGARVERGRNVNFGDGLAAKQIELQHQGFWNF